MIATAAAPIAIPAMAPEERLEECLGTGAALEVAAAVWVVDEEELVLVVVGAPAALVKGSGVLSAGHGSPGCNIKVEFSASCFCRERDVDAFGLMTPTIP